MKIYIDGALLNMDNVVGIKRKEEMYSQAFALGTTLCRVFTISVLNSALNTPNIVTLLEDDNTPIATLRVDSKEDDGFVTDLTCTDRMILGNFGYDASAIFVNDQTTIGAIVNDICAQIGVTAPSGYYGANKVITWYDNTISARSYLGFVAELNGGYARITNNNALEFVALSNSPTDTISLDDCSNISLGAQFHFDRVGLNNGESESFYPEQETGNQTLFVNANNTFVDTTDLQHIHSIINGLSFYSLSVDDCVWTQAIKCGDTIAFTDGNSTWKTIAQFEWSYNGEWFGGFNLNCESVEQQQTEIISTDKKIRSVGIKVDRNANLIDLHGAQITTIEGQVADQSIHFYVDGDQGQCVVAKDGIIDGEYPSSYLTVKEDGVRIFVDDKVVTDLTASGTHCNEGLGVQKWAIQQGASDRILNFFRKA